MPARTAASFDLDSLKLALPKIFDQAQNTAANHQKNFIALHKLQSQAAAVQHAVQNGKSSKLVGEKAFENAFYEMVIRVLPVKKGTPVADRAVRFLAGYAKFITEKNAEDRKEKGIAEDDETTTERFLSHLVGFLLQGCTAKDKIVRFRVIQCIADVIVHLGEIDEDLYSNLRTTLLDRLRDKEPAVRAQAATALTKLSFTEDPAELNEAEPTILETVLDALAYDPSPDVRRAVLLNMPSSSQTLPALLTRLRDVDVTIRKLVYTNVLEKYCLPPDAAAASMVGYTHPRALTIAQRELIVRHGSGDREDSVRAAASHLLALWVDVVRSDGSKKEDTVKKEAGETMIDDLLAFLHLFDLAEGKVAEDALGSVFNARVDLYENMDFPDEYWENLTPERAFLARVYIDKVVAKETAEEAHVIIDRVLPVTTAMAFRIHDTYNVLVQQIDDDHAYLQESGADEEDEERVRREEARIDREMTIGELLCLGVHLDYGDETGRRKMFQSVRGMLAGQILPEPLLPRALDVLRVLSGGEPDLIRVVVEIVHELRDPLEEDREGKGEDVDESMTEFGSPRKRVPQLPKPVAEMTPDEKARMDETDLRCLSLCIGMLERVNGKFEENVTLEGILGELIVPSVKRHEMALREKGLICLGLCCLIAKRMALGSFQLFLGQVASAPEVLRVRVLQIIFDILMVHQSSFLGPDSATGEQIIDFLLQLLESDNPDRVHALLCMGMAKLMLAGIITDPRVLRTLVLVYISPDTAGNQELRQCLSYFLPVYSYSSAANQERMREIFIPLYVHLTKAYHEWEGEEDMVTPARVSLMFVDWTDPMRAFCAVNETGRKDAEKNPLHLDLATDIIKALFSADYDKENKKALYQMLGKLSLPTEVDDDKVRILKLLVVNLRARRPPQDTVGKNALSKIEAVLSKKYEKQLENFSEEEYRKLEQLKDLFEFLDDVIPLEDDEDEPPKKGRKRRSMSVTTETTTTSVATSGDRTPPPPPSPRHKSKAKRRRFSRSDDESDDDDNRTEASRASPPATPVPTRAVPKRNAAERSKKATTKAFQSIVINSDEEEDDDDDEDKEEATPVTKTKGITRSAAPKSTRARQEAEVDGDIDDMLEGNVTKDSIMDTSSEEDVEEDEVDNIL